MSAANHKPPRKRPARTRRASPDAAPASTYVPSTEASDATAAAREHYHREKARRAGRTRPASHPLEQARRAYQALLAKEAEQAKGGRPRKVVAAKAKRSQTPRAEGDKDQ
jgi:hypothetical protein